MPEESSLSIKELELPRFIEAVHKGGDQLQPLSGSPGPEPNCQRPCCNSPPLTNREREVLVLIAEGLLNKQIASQLGVGIRTVEAHREHTMRKLNIHNVAGLTKFALSQGLISLTEQPHSE